MNCMKCGREVALGQVFCKECLADMAQYPVNPATPVILPPERSTTTAKRSSRKSRKPEEQLSRMRRMMISMMLVFTLIVVVATSVIYCLCKRIDTLEQANASLVQELEN